MFGILVSTCTYSLVDYGIGETFQNSFKSVQLFGAVLSALGARKFSTQCPKWKYLPRALDARAFSFRASDAACGPKDARTQNGLDFIGLIFAADGRPARRGV